MDFSNVLSLSIPEGEVAKITSGSTVLWNKPIEKTVTGSYISVNDSINAKIKGFKLYGKSTQNGTPTPTAPIEIENVVNPTITSSGLKSGQVSHVEINEPQPPVNLVSTSVDENGDIYNGTGYNIGYALYIDGHVEAAAAEKLTVVSGFIPYTPQLGDVIKCEIRSASALATAGNVMCWYASDHSTVYGVAIRNIISNENCHYIGNNLYFIVTADILAQMTNVAYIRFSRTSVVPVTTASVDEFVVSIAKRHNILRKAGSVRDELVINADGTGKFIQRVDEYKISGDESVGYNEQNYFIIEIPTLNAMTQARLDVVCDRQITKQAILENGTTYMRPAGNGFIFVNHAYTTTADMKAYLRQQINAGTPMTYQFALATPIETDLSAEEVQNLLLLQTFSPATVVSNDKGADMEVTYLSRG